MKIAKLAGGVLILALLGVALMAGQTSTTVPRITDLFSADEAKNAGLSKLSRDEITALNGAVLRIFITLNTKVSASSTVDSATTGADEVDFYDSRGRAVAYLAADSDLTIYLWQGKPVSYLDEDNLYGFNGKHLGWFEKGAIYDHDGNVVAAVADRFKAPVTTAPIKGFQQFLPFKSFKQFAPFKPFFNVSWAATPAQVFFAEGAK